MSEKAVSRNASTKAVPVPRGPQLQLHGAWQLHDGSDASGKDGGTKNLGPRPNYNTCVAVEYIWLDAQGLPRSKTKTCSHKPERPEDLPVWNFDGSSTDQAPGEDSEVLLLPRALFRDPFRGGDHMMVMAECVTPDKKPAIGNYRAVCAFIMNKYKKMDPWFGIEQEYTLMKPTTIGDVSCEPYGFNADGSEPAPQGPYYCGAGAGRAIGRQVAEDHYAYCLYAGVKVSGVNAEVMPGQWEFQVGPCRGLEVADHMHMARYILFRTAEMHNIQVSIDPKPMEEGSWNGAGCHTNFSTAQMRAEGGMSAITTVCEAFGKCVEKHVKEYGEGNEKRLTGLHETCSINEFKYGVADRGASIRIPREAAMNNKGYMEDRRPAANCDPYRVCKRMMQTAGEALS